MNFAVGILFETMGDTLPRDSATIRSWLAYFATTYTNMPGMYLVNGGPVVMPWCSNLIPLPRGPTFSPDYTARASS